MSGGAFDYRQFRFEDIAELIDAYIKHNDTVWDNDGDEEPERNFSPSTLAKFREAAELVRKAQIFVHRIDWLVSGDDSEDSFHERLKKDLEELNGGN